MTTVPRRCGCNTCTKHESVEVVAPAAPDLEKQLQALREEATHVSAVRHSSRLLLSVMAREESPAFALTKTLEEIESEIVDVLWKLGRAR